MLKGRDLIMIFDRFVGPKKGSSVAQDARVQVRGHQMENIMILWV